LSICHSACMIVNVECYVKGAGIHQGPGWVHGCNEFNDASNIGDVFLSNTVQTQTVVAATTKGLG